MTNQETKAWQAIERAASSEEDLCEANLTRFFGKDESFQKFKANHRENIFAPCIFQNEFLLYRLFLSFLTINIM